MDSEHTVWRAANQMMRMYPTNPAWAAAQLSNAAIETGDMVNYRHWLMVACAILKLQQRQECSAKPRQTPVPKRYSA